MRVWLVGMMGAGKSTVGQLVASRLGVPFVDLDDRVEMAAHATIAELFAREGEHGFRAREAAEVARAAHEGDAVIAVGGGAPCFGENLAKMLSSGIVVWLSAPVDELAARVGDGAGRPLLLQAGSDEKRRETIARLLAARTPYYARASVTIDTTGQPPSRVASAVLEAIGKAGSSC
jgi:shikimate kinase